MEAANTKSVDDSDYKCKSLAQDTMTETKSHSNTSDNLPTNSYKDGLSIPSDSTPQSDVQDLSFTRPDLLVPRPQTPLPDQNQDTTNIEIRISPGCGKGVFALHDIQPGSIILFEKPLLAIPHAITEMVDPSPDPLEALVNELPPQKKEVVMGLCEFRRHEGERVIRGIVYSNGFGIQGGEATGIFEMASRINHSCVPNCDWKWRDGRDGGEGGLMVWNRFKLLKDEEVTVDYGHTLGSLKTWYGFNCTCGGCTDGESEDGGEK